MKIRSVKTFIVVTFVAASANAALTLPPGSQAPNVTPSQFANAMAMVFLYGPGVWVNPGLASMSSTVADSQLFGLPPPPGSPLPPGSPPGTTSACGSNETTAAMDGLLSQSYVPTGNTLPGAAALVGLYSPVGCPAQNTNPPFYGPPVPSDSQTIMLGLDGAAATNKSASAWVQDLMSIYLGLKAKNMGIDLGNSSGGMLLNEILLYYLYPTPKNSYFSSNSDETARQIYWRHNLQVASYRAIGLNPMWAGAVPLPAGTVDAGVADYYVNVYAKFFYNEGLKSHMPKITQPDFLGLLYKVFAANLSYGAGLMQYRYAPIDPSCRYPINAQNVCPILPSDLTALYYEWNNGSPALSGNPWIVNFGTAGDFVTVYDMIKFFANFSGADPHAIALALAGGDTSSFIAAAKSALSGVATYPTSVATTIAAAKAIFDNAYSAWTKETAVAQVSAILMPRPSSALIVAAALIGKRIDPLFWGPLAEAEQYEMKANPGGYAAWVDKLLDPSNANLPTQLRIAMWDYANFRPITAARTPATLSKLMNVAEDPSTQMFALARGPNGLDSIDGERFEMASEYDNKNLSPMPYPNAFLEAAESGRPMIDGRLLIGTNGQVNVLDIDDSLANSSSPNVTLPFEVGVLKAYQKTAAEQVLSVAPNQEPAQIAAMALQTQNQIGAPISTSAESDYQVSAGVSKPLNPNQSDSRYFQPTLEYWLVIADKLNSNGIDTLANYDPPELQTMTYNPVSVMTDPNSKVTYGLMNIGTQINSNNMNTYILTSLKKPYNPPSGSVPPTSDAMPLDSDQVVAAPTPNIPPRFIKEVLQIQQQVISSPFLCDSKPGAADCNPFL